MSKKNNYIDENGKPYIEDVSWPAGGGLHKDCDHNTEALHAFNELQDFERIGEYLEGEGFNLAVDDFPYVEVWEKGNTQIVFEDYNDGLWGYLHTEFINA